MAINPFKKKVVYAQGGEKILSPENFAVGVLEEAKQYQEKKNQYNVKKIAQDIRKRISEHYSFNHNADKRAKRLSDKEYAQDGKTLMLKEKLQKVEAIIAKFGEETDIRDERVSSADFETILKESFYKLINLKNKDEIKKLEEKEKTYDTDKLTYQKKITNPQLPTEVKSTIATPLGVESNFKSQVEKGNAEAEKQLEQQNATKQALEAQAKTSASSIRSPFASKLDREFESQLQGRGTTATGNTTIQDPQDESSKNYLKVKQHMEENLKKGIMPYGLVFKGFADYEESVLKTIKEQVGVELSPSDMLELEADYSDLHSKYIGSKYKVKNPSTEQPKVVTDDIATLDNLSYAEAWAKAREHFSTQGDKDGIGQFKWKGQLHGTAYNTSEELKKYDAKYKTNIGEVFTGSGIAGETYEGLRLAEKVQINKQTSPESKVGDKVEPIITPKTPITTESKKYINPYLNPSNYAGVENKEVTKDILNPTTKPLSNQSPTKKLVGRQLYEAVKNNEAERFYTKDVIYEIPTSNPFAKIYKEGDIITQNDTNDIVYKVVEVLSNSGDYKNKYKVRKFENTQKEQGGKLSINPFIPKAQQGMQLGVKPNTYTQGFNQYRTGADTNSYQGNTNIGKRFAGLDYRGIDAYNGAGEVDVMSKMQGVNYNLPTTFNPFESSNQPLNFEDELSNNIPTPTQSEMTKSKITGLSNLNDGQGKKITREQNTGNKTGGMSLYDKAFLGMSAINTVKGYLGRGVKPPQRSLYDRQNIIGATQGMNQYAKDTALQGMANQGFTASQNNKTIDSRLNTASMLGTQEQLNNSATQFNAQDSQMYQQDVNRQLGQRQDENLRMLQNKQNFNNQIQTEALQNYQAQQAASQASINQGTQGFLTYMRDKENREATQKTNDQLTKATLYQNQVGKYQSMVKAYPAPDGNGFVVEHFDEEGNPITTTVQDSATANALMQKGKISGGLTRAVMKGMPEELANFKQYTGELKNGGKLGNGFNPFSRNKDITEASKLHHNFMRLQKGTALHTKFK